MTSKRNEKKFIDELREKGIGVSRTEDKLAGELRKRNIHYVRQEKIGIYRVDFFIPPKIIVEIQGPYHDESKRLAWDRNRLEYLESRGYRVYNISSSDVHQNPGEFADLIANLYKRLKHEKPA